MISLQCSRVTWQTYGTIGVRTFGFMDDVITSSIKPEVRNVMHNLQKRGTEPRPQVTCTKFTDFEMCQRTDRQTDRQTDTWTP